MLIGDMAPARRRDERGRTLGPITLSDKANMRTIDVHEAQKRLASLVDEAARGAPFVIAKAGKPLVKVTAVDAPTVPRRLGFLAGQIVVPEDIDRMGEAEIATLFGAEP